MALTQRIKAALQAFRLGEFRYPGNYGIGRNYSDNTAQQAILRRLGIFTGSRINFAREIGDLTQQSLIMAAANWLGTQLPEAPLQVVQEDDSGNVSPVQNHPLTQLWKRPTKWYSGALILKAFALSWIIDGNVYLLKLRDGSGRVVSLEYLPHFAVEPQWPQDGSEFISHYLYEVDGRWFRLPVEDVIHFRNGLDPANTRKGLSPVGSVLREVFTDSERARYSALILKSNGAIPYLVSPDPDLSNVELNEQEIKDEFMRRITGDETGKPIVITSGGVKIQQLGITPDKLLVDKASQIPEERLAAVLGIPAAVLGFGVGLDQTKVGATMRELREQAYENCIVPTYRLICDELDVQLLPEFESESSTRKTRFDLSQVRVLQDDQNALYERLTSAYKVGEWITRAEARAAAGMVVDESRDNVFYSETTGARDARNELAEPQPKQEPTE